MLPQPLKTHADAIFADLSDQVAESERPIFIVMRGLPGSGKSSVSKEIQRRFQEEQSTQVVRVCTDEILEMCEGSYLWAGYKMAMYHPMAFKLVSIALKKQVPIVILDNTNIMTKDFEHYIMDAQQKGYTVRCFTVGEFTPEAIELCVVRNSHNVPREAIERMARRFQV
jgi:predicted ABC-type ATPase